MRIKFDGDEVFTYCASDLTVGVHHPKGNWFGAIDIQFDSPTQVYHFKEMLDFILEKAKEDGM
jgi:hypothetical protein